MYSTTPLPNRYIAVTAPAALGFGTKRDPRPLMREPESDPSRFTRPRAEREGRDSVERDATGRRRKFEESL
jgi:hypothetical protein